MTEKESGFEKLERDLEIAKMLAKEKAKIPYNGGDPITPERALFLAGEICSAYEELALGILGIERDENKIPKRSEDAMAVYISKMMEGLLDPYSLKAIIKNDFYMNVFSEMGEFPDIIEGEIYTIADFYEKYPEHFVRAIKSFYK